MEQDIHGYDSTATIISFATTNATTVFNAPALFQCNKHSNTPTAVVHTNSTNTYNATIVSTKPNNSCNSGQENSYK
jgi:hypothetical protein